MRRIGDIYKRFQRDRKISGKTDIKDYGLSSHLRSMVG